jgi:hypothetical protein
MAYGERQNSVRDGICSGFESFVAICRLNLESGNLVDVVGAFHTMAEWLAKDVRYSAVFLELMNAFSALYMCTCEGGYKPETSKFRGYNAVDVLVPIWGHSAIGQPLQSKDDRANTAVCTP